MKINCRRNREILITVRDRFRRILAEQLVRVSGVGFMPDELCAPLERTYDAIVVEHREIPLSFVHVALEHRGWSVVGDQLSVGEHGSLRRALLTTGNRRSGTVQDLFVERDVMRNYLVRTVALDRELASFLTKCPPEILVTEKAERVLGHLVDIAYVAEVAGLALGNNFGDATDSCRDHRDLARLRLECRQSERFEFRRQKKDIGNPEIVRYRRLLPDEYDIVFDIQLLGAIKGRRTFRSIADHYQPDILSPCLDLREYFDAIDGTLHSSKVRHMHKQFFSIRSKLVTQR